MVCMVLVEKTIHTIHQFMTRQRTPRPGSKRASTADRVERYGPPHPSQFALPPWNASDWQPAEPKPQSEWKPPKPLDPPLLRVIKITDRRDKHVAMTKLKAARKRVTDLAAVVRDEVFEDWIERCVVVANRPDEWTRSRALYDAYVAQAPEFGVNRTERSLARQEIATETQWGRMMGSLFPNKKRRRDGWYYPVRLKRRT